MRPKTFFFLTGLIAALTLNAQPSTPAYDFRAIVQPGMIIGGHAFSPDTVVDSASLNEAGEVAFLCHWRENGDVIGGVFTSHRLVVRQGEIFDDGTYLVIFPEHATVAINAAGSVAYVGQYAGKDADGAYGIFIERRLALGPLYLDPPIPFTLTDDGRVLLTHATTAKSAAQKRPGVLDRVQIRMPKMPKDVPVAISPSRNTPVKSAPVLPIRGERPPFPVMAANHSGQQVILVKLAPSGFFLLLATPTH
jgi:hypothetical protein